MLAKYGKRKKIPEKEKEMKTEAQISQNERSNDYLIPGDNGSKTDKGAFLLCLKSEIAEARTWDTVAR